jgi:hypothetical protein
VYSIDADQQYVVVSKLTIVSMGRGSARDGG